MKNFILLFFVFFTANSYATDNYFCKCDTGADAACVAGSDANSGLSAALAKSPFPTASTLNSAAAGDRFLFCQGGAWTGLSTIEISNTNATAASPLTLGAYTASFGATTRPRLSWPANTDAIHFGNYLNTVDDKGYVFSGIHFRAEGAGTGVGLWFLGRTSDVLLTNIRVEGVKTGTLMSNTASAPIARITLRNSVYDNQTGDGWQGAGASDTTLEYNEFTNNNTNTDVGGCSPARCHAMYIGAAGPSTGGTVRLTIRGNVLSGNSVGGSGCSGGNITLHGQHDQVLIEENTIVETAATVLCGGIMVNKGYSSQEFVRRLVIRGNTVVGAYSGSAIYNDLGSGAIIENNRVIDNISGSTFGQGLRVNSNSGADGDDQPDNNIVRNNTCYLLYASSRCFNLEARTGHTVINNLAYTGASSSGNCFANASLASYSVWNYNHCYRAGSGNWSATYSSLGLAQAAGFDANGSQGDPLFTTTPSSGNSWDLSVQAGSPVVSTGTSTEVPPRDVLWCMRKTPPDKGAHDRSATPCQTIRSPVNVR